MAPRDIASRAAKEVCDEGRGVGPGGRGVYLDFRDRIRDLGRKTIAERYDNLFQMYERITGDDPYTMPMRIYPAPHYTMGGTWVDYNLMSTIPGLFVIGEANFSDHGANRLGASALMQGLADGYFVLPYTIGDFLAGIKPDGLQPDGPAFTSAENEQIAKLEKLLAIKGKRTVDSLHRELGKIMWNECGMARSEHGLQSAITQIQSLRDEFWKNINVVGSHGELNNVLERAGRVADFMEFAELMCLDALERRESCGGHFRTEYQQDGEAMRDDQNFSHVAAWEYHGQGKPTRHIEPLEFTEVKPTIRSYK
jgi:succinate dehydrogenase / fumarate reductase flavoprotein subunit